MLQLAEYPHVLVQITMGFGLFYGGLAQFCAGMWEFWRNNIFAGVVFTSYGSFWLNWAMYNILALVRAGIPLC
jgi:uncharacterized protein